MFSDAYTKTGRTPGAQAKPVKAPSVWVVPFFVQGLDGRVRSNSEPSPHGVAQTVFVTCANLQRGFETSSIFDRTHLNVTNFVCVSLSPPLVPFNPQDFKKFSDTCFKYGPGPDAADGGRLSPRPPSTDQHQARATIHHSFHREGDYAVSSLCASAFCAFTRARADKSAASANSK